MKARTRTKVAEDIRACSQQLVGDARDLEVLFDRICRDESIADLEPFHIMIDALGQAAAQMMINLNRREIAARLAGEPKGALS